METLTGGRNIRRLKTGEEEEEETDGEREEEERKVAVSCAGLHFSL